MVTNRRTVAKWLGYSVLILFALLLQISVFPRLPVPNPLVSAAAVIPLAIFAGPAGGAAAGLAAGLLCDAMLPAIEAYFALTMMAAGAAAGYICGKFMQKNFWSALLLGLLFISGINFFYALIFHILSGRADWNALWQVALPEVAVSLPWVAVFYPAFRGVSKRFTEE